uniref:Uncharacterized protein n=1 Tax=Anguilla anguilla TaxID=7936 RepID=A0A0E9PWT4_ANGAN
MVNVLVTDFISHKLRPLKLNYNCQLISR